MTYQELFQKGYLLTENEVKENAKLILKQYQTALDQINDKLAVLYARAKDGGVKPADMYNWAIQYDRLGNLQKQAKEAYAKYDKIAGKMTENAVSTAFNNQYYRDYYALSWADPINFATLNQDIVSYALTGELDTWKRIQNKLGQAGDWTPASGTISSLVSKNRAKALEDIATQINAGLINGESYASVVKRLETIIGTVYKGEASGILAKAMRIVMTESHRAQEMGQYAAALSAEQEGLKIVRMWDASLDSATRPEHAAADGQKVPTDKPFTVGGEELMYPGDPSGRPSNVIRCRCVATTLANDFEPTSRRGRDPVTGKNEVFSYKSFAQWAEEKGLKTNKYGQLYKG